MNFDMHNKVRRRSRLGRRRVPDEHPCPTVVVPSGVYTTVMPAIPVIPATTVMPAKPKKENMDPMVSRRLFLKSPMSDVSLSGSLKEVSGFHQISPSPNNSKIECSKYSYMDTNYLGRKFEKPQSPGPSEYKRLLFEELNKVKKPVDPGDNIHMNKWLDEQYNSLRKHVIENKSPTMTKEPSVEEPSKLSTDILPVLKKPEEHSSSDCNLRLLNNDDTTKPDTKTSVPHTSTTIKEPPTVTRLNELQEDFFEFKKPDDLSDRLRLIKLFSSNSKSIDSVNSERYNSITANKPPLVEHSTTPLVESPVDLNSTDSFELAEQTVLEQDQAIIDDATTFSVPKVINTKCNGLLQSISEEQSDSNSDEDVLQECVEEINQIVKQMATLQTKVLKLQTKIQKLVKKKRKTKLNLDNKENISTKWMNTLKLENPALLKTPKVNRNSKLETSIMDQSAILTPHSLSTVVKDQIDALFE